MTLSDQFRHTFYEPDFKCAVYFATCKFDGVWKKKPDGRVVQFMHDLATCKQDCTVMRKMMKKFKILDTGPKGIYNMDNDPTIETLRNVSINLRQRFRANPDKKFLVMYTFSGHGIESQG